MKKIALVLLLLLIVPATFAAIDFDGGLTQDEEDQIDAILAPVMKIYNFIKYTATVIAVLMLVFAGLTFTTAGGDQLKKEKAKNMAIGVVFGLVLIWMAPLIVGFIFT